MSKIMIVSLIRTVYSLRLKAENTAGHDRTQFLLNLISLKYLDVLTQRIWSNNYSVRC